MLRGFYDFQRDVGAGPILNPFPLDIARRSERANAHHNPMDAWKHDRVGRYRPKVPQRIPRAIPDDRFNTLFTALPSNRDRAMVAFGFQREPARQNCSVFASAMSTQANN